ncbi:MAG: uroporphyrinogen-III synthase [Sideroxydans sp.]
MADTPLAGLRIVVTRPQQQAAGLAQRITALGGIPLLFPLLEIGPAPDPSALHDFAQQAGRYQLLIFISPNAVQYGMQALQRLPAEVKVAAVGQGSARALRALGVAHVMAPEGRADSEALLALPELQKVSGWRIAILRGDGGRELLGDTLAARGAAVEYITCYRRRKAALDIGALRAARPDAITLTSSEALAHLDAALADAGAFREKIPLFVPHPRIAAAARALGWKTVLPTASGDDGLCAGLVAWALQRSKVSRT